MISFDSVTKIYPGDVKAVDRVSFQIEPGEFLVLLGESGCGKTTTLKMINRLIDISSGTITVDDDDVMQVPVVDLRRRIGYVFQGVGLFPHMTVGENIAVQPHLLKWSKSQIDERVVELLDMVNLPAVDYADRMPHELSGGQRQRIGVARALAARPRTMLMDEPFGALDPLTRDQLQQDFVKLHQKLSLTTVMVTHDMTEALLLADRIAVMQAGRILQIGTPHELLAEPTHDYVRELMQTPKRQAERLEALIESEV